LEQQRPGESWANSDPCLAHLQREVFITDAVTRTHSTLGHGRHEPKIQSIFAAGGEQCGFESCGRHVFARQDSHSTLSHGARFHAGVLGEAAKSIPESVAIAGMKSENVANI
jgi:hypothetical protein